LSENRIASDLLEPLMLRRNKFQFARVIMRYCGLD